MGRNELIYELQPNRKAITFFKKVEYDTKWRIHQATTSVPFWCNFLFSFSSPLSSLSSFSFSSYHLTQRSFYISFFIPSSKEQRGSLKRCTRYSRFNFSGSNNFDPASSTIFLDVLNPSMRPISRVPTHAQVFRHPLGFQLKFVTGSGQRTTQTNPHTIHIS